MIKDKQLEEINNFRKETQEIGKRQLKETKKTGQDLKMEIKARKKTQTEGILETENLGKQTWTTSPKEYKW